jgi:hypothetical protein
MIKLFGIGIGPMTFDDYFKDIDPDVLPKELVSHLNVVLRTATIENRDKFWKCHDYTENLNFRKWEEERNTLKKITLEELPLDLREPAKRIVAHLWNEIMDQGIQEKIYKDMMEIYCLGQKSVDPWESLG